MPTAIPAQEPLMPHVIVKLWPGNTPQQKQRLADAITQDVVKVLGSREESVSVAFEEVRAEEWKARVYEPDIASRMDELLKKPGYSM